MSLLKNWLMWYNDLPYYNFANFLLKIAQKIKIVINFKLITILLY